MSLSLSNSQKRLLMIFGSILVVILLLMFLNPIRNERVVVEKSPQYVISEGEYANYRIRFTQGEKVDVNFTIKARRDGENNTFRNIDVLFLNEKNFVKYQDGNKPDLIEYGTSINSSKFSVDFELKKQGVYYIVFDNTNMFTLGNKHPRSFSADRTKVSFNIKIEKTQSVIGLPES